MKRSFQTDKEKFQRELDIYRSTAAKLTRGHSQTSFLEKQLIFWMESARFLINELEIWGMLGDPAKYDATVNKIQKNLDCLNELITQLTEEQSRDIDPNEAAE